jgi:hypothetical protein
VTAAARRYCSKRKEIPSSAFLYVMIAEADSGRSTLIEQLREREKGADRCLEK